MTDEQNQLVVNHAVTALATLAAVLTRSPAALSLCLLAYACAFASRWVPIGAVRHVVWAASAGAVVAAWIIVLQRIV